ncbi:MAG: hypothetical protein B6I25_01485 [Planctomycetales bacterium 4572_13]|nr:MAG: hypothetical protein B6I25_01485 [Planctomycetales bacterium 4572_13]
MKKKKKIKRRQRPVCGLCGNRGKLTKTECCGQWICDDEDQYVAFSYARNSCHRNHRRYTLCGYHDAEGHKGDWKDCKQCREDFSDDLEMYVEYGTNEYNFEKLPNPPSFEPTYCSKCGELIVKANGGYSVRNGVYTCNKCDSGPLEQLNKFNPLADLDLDDWDDDDEDWDDDFEDFDDDRSERLSFGNVEDIAPSIRPRFDDISLLITQFCADREAVVLALLCMDMNVTLCVEFPQVIRKCKAESWACGIIHALGIVNFLSDPESDPHIKSSEIYPFFKVSQGTMQSKSLKIRELLCTGPMDPMWSLPDMLLKDPMLWFVPMDGMMIDIRDAAPEIQQKALDDGLIPILPDEMKRQIDEQKEIMEEAARSMISGMPKTLPSKSSGQKTNIKIADYLPDDSKHSTPPEKLPLFDPPEKE